MWWLLLCLVHERERERESDREIWKLLKTPLSHFILAMLCKRTQVTHAARTHASEATVVCVINGRNARQLARVGVAMARGPEIVCTSDTCHADTRCHRYAGRLSSGCRRRAICVCQFILIVGVCVRECICIQICKNVNTNCSPLPFQPPENDNDVLPPAWGTHTHTEHVMTPPRTANNRQTRETETRGTKTMFDETRANANCLQPPPNRESRAEPIRAERKEATRTQFSIGHLPRPAAYTCC